MQKVRTDFSNFPHQKIGSGTFGAKTTKLESFKASMEKSGLITLPSVSFPIEYFRSALVRATLVDQCGKFTGQTSGDFPIDFGINQTRQIQEITKFLKGFIVAVRSDERSAKGCGVFETQFVEARDILWILKRILRSQFSESAQVFKRLTQIPDEIGIMLMPLAGQNFDLFEDVLYGPSVSVAGFTIIDRNEVRLSIGFGIGGGVNQYAVQTRFRGGKIDFLEFPPEIRLMEAQDRSISDEKFAPNILVTDFGFPNIFEAQNSSDDFCNRILSVARERQTDVYFEAQLIDHKAGLFAVTQIAEHTWPKIDKPNGKEIIKITGYRNIVGSGVKVLDHYVFLPSPSYVLDEKKGENIAEVRFKLIRENPGALVIFDRDSLNLHSLATYEYNPAIINLTDHIRPFSCHISGAFRETGKIVLNAGGYNYFINELSGKKFAVWADELNEEAGIVLL
ncbi:MAG: hypothetical protein AABX38_05545 [Candidatus Micrarchaeota archaeon]